MTTANDGSYSDKVAKTTTTATYQVCDDGGSTRCSDEIEVGW